ncbi:polysaccharide deacetylase family protein [Pseudonocardia phyllosphaerae]|uniref:polysaccharide deacetylase family protein n=1 Tax=Pseudonocardia phyllosphaerae TaxID=3390502 RepID=UPI00397D7CD6
MRSGTQVGLLAALVGTLALAVLLLGGVIPLPDVGSAARSWSTAPSAPPPDPAGPEPSATGPAPDEEDPEPPRPPVQAPPATGPAAVTTDPAGVSHLFFHSLIVDPQRAFADPHSGKGFHDFMVTVDQFRTALDDLYSRGYVLVDPHALAAPGPDGTMTARRLELPPGRKPLVLSIDDVSYYEYMDGDGFASNLVVDSAGRVRNTYVDRDRHTHVGAYDVMPIVDDFVAQHPDFSHDGARGVIGMTGYNGVLGYRTSPSVYGGGRNPHLAADIDTARRVADAMKAQGWQFASHSWGHIDFAKSSAETIRRDDALWKAEVEPVIGPTDLLIYPYGADIAGIEPYAGDKYRYLHDAGYRYFFNVDGSRVAWGQVGHDYLRQGRINVDGISLDAAKHGRPVLGHFFDVGKVAPPGT